MLQKNSFCALIIILSTLSVEVNAKDKRIISVVTCFSILEDLVTELGGDRVSIINLVGRNSDAHIYQPKPSDAVAIANADLVVMNGLGFEGWVSRLLDNNGYAQKRLVASRSVKPLITDDDVDPHAWQSFRNIKIYIDNITQILVEISPEFKDEFEQHNKRFKKKITLLEQDLAKQISIIPKNQRIVVTSHDAFAYLGREFDIQFIAPMGFSTESEPTASDVANLIDQINSQGVKALFVENISNPRLLQQIASETGISIGGNLYSDALGDTSGPAATYVQMMRHNIESIRKALTIEKLSNSKTNQTTEIFDH